MKRDSTIWMVMLVSSVLTFLLSNQNLLQEAGVSPQVEAWIELIAGCLGAVAGFLRMSPLALSDAGREKFTGTGDGTVDPKRLVSILILASSLGLASCAGTSAPPPQTAPPPLASELKKAVDWADTAIMVAQTLQQVEIEAYRNGRVSDADHRTIQTALLAFFDTAIEALTAAQDLAKPDVSRWAAAKSVGQLAYTMVGRIKRLLPAEVHPYLTALEATLQLLGFAAPAPVTP